MKLTRMLVLGIAAVTLFASCRGAEEHPHDVEAPASDAVSVVPGDGLDGLVLDNGRRWLMDDHTRSTFAKMATSFLDLDQGSLEGEGLKTAAADLQVLTADLIRGCTMTGEAHDQLHAYLTGYMPAVEALSKSGRIDDAGKVTHYLESYDEYFE